MSIEIFSGLESDDASQALLENAKIRSKDAKQRFYFIVPNHAKFSAEVSLLKRYAALLEQDGLFASNQLHVFSFSRFNWFLTKNLNNSDDFRINRTGLFILVNQIIDEHYEELKTFKKALNSSGSIEKIVDQLLEIRSSQMTVAQLLDELDDKSENQRLKDKLLDLQIVEKYLYSTIDGNFSLEMDSLVNFSQQLDSINLYNTTIYLTGFSDFTNLELSVVKKLSEKTDIKISLTNSRNRGDLFTITNNLIEELKNFSAEKKIDFELTEINEKRNLSENQTNFELHFLNQFNNENNKLEKIPTINLISASDNLAELNYIAGKIRQLINDNSDVSLSDILVEARSLQPYKNYLKSVFETHEITPFIDLDQTMNQHPLSEFLLIILKQTKNSNFYQNTNLLLRLLKTKLLVNDGIDDFGYALSKFENYLIEFSPSNKSFDEGFTFKTKDYSDDDLELINQLRNFVVCAIDDFNKQLNNALNNKDAATKLIKLLYKYKIDQRIIQISDQFSDNLQLSQRQLQVWNNFNSTLEQIVTLSSDDKFDGEIFADALSIGFSGSNFARIPATLNQLTVTEAGAAQSNDYKYVFYIGATRDALPQYSKNKLIINDADRETLEEIFEKNNYEYRLKQTANQLAANEPYFFYKALLSATEEVFISYVENADSKPSNYVLKLKNDANQITTVSNYIQNSEDLKNHIGSPRYLINQISHLSRLGITLTDFENQILNSNDKELFENILNSRNYQNLGANINKETIKKIFNNQFNFSISQLEKYNNNPFEYFLSYVLSIKERKRFEFDSATAGNFSHQLLDQLFEKIIEDNSSLADFDATKLKKMFDDLSENLKEDEQYSNLLSSVENQSILDDQIENLWKNLLTMKKISEKNHTKTIKTESEFSDLKLDENSEFNLKGRIDRVDQLIKNDDEINLIIDYKSRVDGKKFDLVDFWYGLELQLMTYWMASEKNQPTKAALFAKIIDKPISVMKLTADEIKVVNSFFGETPNTPDRQREQFSGIFDKELTDEIGFSAKTGYSSREIDLFKHKHLNNINQTANNIINGLFPIAPYKRGTDNGLMYSPYKSIINFDATLGDQYNEIKDNATNIKNNFGDIDE